MNRIPAGQAAGPVAVVVALGTTQTIAWASSYYLPAILAAPIARDLGLAPTHVFAALSGALVIAGLLGPRVGHAIDTFGGRGLLAASGGPLFASAYAILYGAGNGIITIARGTLPLALFGPVGSGDGSA